MAKADHKIHSWRGGIRYAAQRAMNGRRAYHSMALWLIAVFRFDRPKRLRTAETIAVHQPHICDPDYDNLVKGMQDACNGVVWADDCIISSATLRKRYTLGDEQPGVAIRVLVDDPKRWRA